MNTKEHLLACLAEECAEIQQAVSKALRFGLDDGYPGTNRTNEQDIQDECAQFVGVLEMLEAEVFTGRDIGRLQRIVEEKKVKVRHYMEYAKERGALDG